MEKIARHYAGYLQTTPPKLKLSLSADERNVFILRSPTEFECLLRIFASAPNYEEINTNGHHSFSAGLKCFVRYLEHLARYGGNDKNPTVSETNAVPNLFLKVLIEDYPNGFKFESTAFRLLADKTGVDVDEKIQAILKGMMFRRSDDVCFLADVVADSETRENIIAFANNWLVEFGGFEISELYDFFKSNLNEKCIDSVETFEGFYEFICNSNVCCCVSKYGTRIARIRDKSLDTIFTVLVKKIIVVTHDEFGGVVSEDDLKHRFTAFSTDLLASIIKYYTEELVRIEINGIYCYQTLDAFGLSDEFSDLLAETLARIDEIGLIPTDGVLHTAISLRLGVNFRVEYNLPDDKTYRCLIAAYYKDAHKREWKNGKFIEVQD